MKASLKDFFLYYLYLFLKFILLLLPKGFAKVFLIFLAKAFYYLNKKYNAISMANLNLVYENKISLEEKKRIILESYKSLLFNFYEFIENQSASKETILSKAKIENEEIITKAIKENRKIIIVSAHYGAWELAIPYIALKFGTLCIVNRKMNNPLINKMYKKVRDRNNIVMVEKKEAGKGLIKALKQNHNVSVVIDQHIKNGVEIDFLGKKVMATDSTSRLALKFDAVIIPVFCQMNDFRDSTLKVYDAIDPLKIDFKMDDKIKELTILQNKVVEKQIKMEPSQWFWQHKRWKGFYKEIYE